MYMGKNIARYYDYVSCRSVCTVSVYLLANNVLWAHHASSRGGLLVSLAYRIFVKFF